MTTQGRFSVFKDENQVPKAGLVGGHKRAPLGVLSDANQKPASNVLKPLNEKQGFKKQDRQPLCDKNAACIKENQENIVPRPVSKIKVTREEAAENVPPKVVDIHMDSPLPQNSPMIISPTTEIAKTSNVVATTTKEDLLDDKFFTRQYGKSHYSYMKKMEIKLKARQDYMTRQRDISSEMRSVLVDWLVEVNEEYQMSDEALFLAVSLTDRFLSLMSVVRGKLQLVGTAAVFVASKVEEIYPPQISELVYITDDTYTASQIIRMEALLLKNLDFSVGGANALTFLRNLAVEGNLSVKVSHMAQYIAELSLLNISSLSFKPSELAAASIVLAIHQINGNTKDWTPELREYADVDESQLKEAMLYLHGLLTNANSSPHQATPNKYSHKRYSSVSLLELKPTVPSLP